MKLRRGALAAFVACLLGILSALPAIAATPLNGVQNEGPCSQSSEWKLKADSDNGRIKVEAEVDTGIKGQHWSWRLIHNGSLSARGNAVTKDGGSYTVQRNILDAPGLDRIVFKSHNAGTGEQCHGSVKF